MDILIILLLLFTAIVSSVVQGRVHHNFEIYAKVPGVSGLTGRETAEKILHDAGIQGVRITCSGNNPLSNHYNPSKQELSLSEFVMNSSSVSAVCVAAHEAGHALQHASNYGPLMLRTASAVSANFGSRLSIPLVIIGLLIQSTPLAMAGILLYALMVLFTLVTLPVEFNASSRAMALLKSGNILSESQLSDADSVLRAAAMTYVMAALAAILQLLRLALMVIGNSRRNRD